MMKSAATVGSPGIPGGCASSQLDHCCKIPPREAALAADLITARRPFWGGCASSPLDHGFPDGRGAKFRSRWELIIWAFRAGLGCQISFEMLEDQPRDQVGC